MGNQQMVAALAAFRVHLEKQERRVCRAKKESIDQQKLNRMKKQIQRSVCLVLKDGRPILPVPNVSCVVLELLVMVANNVTKENIAVAPTTPQNVSNVQQDISVKQKVVDRACHAFPVSFKII